MSDTNNPPAFAAATCGDWQEGMSLRDYFAGQAIIAQMIVFGGAAYITPTLKGRDAPYMIEDGPIAAAAFRMADAMMEARKPKGEQS